MEYEYKRNMRNMEYEYVICLQIFLAATLPDIIKISQHLTE